MEKHFLTKKDLEQDQKEIMDFLDEKQLGKIMGGFEWPYNKMYANTTYVNYGRIPPQLKEA